MKVVSTIIALSVKNSHHFGQFSYWVITAQRRGVLPPVISITAILPVILHVMFIISLISIPVILILLVIR